MPPKPSMRGRCPNDASIRGSSPSERANRASGEVATRVRVIFPAEYIENKEQPARWGSGANRLNTEVY